MKAAILLLLLFTQSLAIAHPFKTRGRIPQYRFQDLLAYKLSPMGQNPVLYYGGPVLSNVKVYAVFWNSHVDPSVQQNIGPFYQGLVASNFVTDLAEYRTDRAAVDGRTGTNQAIGRGTFGGNIVWKPFNTSQSLTRKDYEREIEAQIDAKNLPKPDSNTVLMIHFPARFSLDIDGERACDSWCGDHEYYVSAKYGPIAYALMPDLSDGSCQTGCGFESQSFDNLTVTASHELAEAITDPLSPPDKSPNAYPGAWLDKAGNEVGDICNDSSTTLTTRLRKYIIQAQWSNAKQSCNMGPFTD